MFVHSLNLEIPSNLDDQINLIKKYPSALSGAIRSQSIKLKSFSYVERQRFCFAAAVASYQIKSFSECFAKSLSLMERFNKYAHLIHVKAVKKDRFRDIRRDSVNSKTVISRSVYDHARNVSTRCLSVNLESLFVTLNGAFKSALISAKQAENRVNYALSLDGGKEEEKKTNAVIAELPKKQKNESEHFDYNVNFFKRNFNEDSEEAYSLSKSLGDPLNENKGPAALKYMALAHKHGYTFSVQYQAFLNSQRAALNTTNKQIRKDERRRQYLADLNARCGIKEPTPIKPKQTENHVQPIQEKKSPEEIKHSLEQLAKVKALLGKTKATTTQKPARDNTYSKTSTDLKAKVVTEIKLNNPTSHHNYGAGSIRSGKVMSALSILPSVLDLLVPDDTDIKVTRTQEQLDTDRLRKELADKQKAMIMRMLNKEVSEPANKPVE